MAPPLNPDCRDGKHPACRGDALDDDTDTITDCQCPCHTTPPPHGATA